MAITLLSTPSLTKVTPAYNENWLVASSSSIAQPKFKFAIVMTDVLSGQVFQTEYVTPNPANLLEIDMGVYAEANMTNYLPANLYGWKKCTGVYRLIRFNIGEYYGTTPTYYAGTNTTYHVWNAGLDMQSFVSYNYANYLWNDTTDNFVMLTALGAKKTFNDRSNYLYFLGTVGNTTDLPSIIVRSYDSTNTLIGTSTIARPAYTTGLYTDQMQCIDVGKKGLDNIASGLVTGTYPILGATTTYYTVHWTCTTVINIAARILNTFTIECEPKYTVYTLHYLNQKGAYETLHCSKVAELTTTKTTTTFKKNPWSNVSNVMIYNPTMALEKTQGVTITDSLKLNSDWLTQSEFDLHRDLFASTDVKLDLGSSTPMVSVKITNGSYTQRNSKKARQLTFDLSYSFNNHRQRG